MMRVLIDFDEIFKETSFKKFSEVKEMLIKLSKTCKVDMITELKIGDARKYLIDNDLNLIVERLYKKPDSNLMVCEDFIKRNSCDNIYSYIINEIKKNKRKNIKNELMLLRNKNKE